jgi:hypothetical protein
MDIKKIFRIFRRQSGGTSVQAGGFSTAMAIINKVRGRQHAWPL